MPDSGPSVLKVPCKRSKASQYPAVLFQNSNKYKYKKSYDVTAGRNPPSKGLQDYSFITTA